MTSNVAFPAGNNRDILMHFFDSLRGVDEETDKMTFEEILAEYDLVSADQPDDEHNKQIVRKFVIEKLLLRYPEVFGIESMLETYRDMLEAKKRPDNNPPLRDYLIERGIITPDH